jgi:hypothetical protein
MVPDAANQLAVNKVGTALAAGAVCSPAWLPSLSTVSTTSAEILPIVGAIYLTLQAAHFLITKRWRRPTAVDPSKDETT